MKPPSASCELMYTVVFLEVLVVAVDGKFSARACAGVVDAPEGVLGCGVGECLGERQAPRLADGKDVGVCAGVGGEFLLAHVVGGCYLEGYEILAFGSEVFI